MLFLELGPSSLKVLPIDLLPRPWPAVIIKLKNRMLGPAAELFVECACDVAKALKVLGPDGRGAGDCAEPARGELGIENSSRLSFLIATSALTQRIRACL